VQIVADDYGAIRVRFFGGYRAVAASFSRKPN
jgi:hypothetical protein